MGIKWIRYGYILAYNRSGVNLDLGRLLEASERVKELFWEIKRKDRRYNVWSRVHDIELLDVGILCISIRHVEPLTRVDPESEEEIIEMDLKTSACYISNNGSLAIDIKAKSNFPDIIFAHLKEIIREYSSITHTRVMLFVLPRDAYVDALCKLKEQPALLDVSCIRFDNLVRGRILRVEYKGVHVDSTPEAYEAETAHGQVKRLIGKLRTEQGALRMELRPNYAITIYNFRSMLDVICLIDYLKTILRTLLVSYIEPPWLILKTN